MRRILKSNKVNEAMSLREKKVKNKLLLFLCDEGFPKFANYLDNFHINFLTSEQAGQLFVAAIDPEKGIVYVNPDLTMDACSVILRHEIAHHVFKHRQHMFAKLKEMGINNPSQLAYRLANIAGDYHISNEIYDEIDKRLVKGLLTKEDGEVARLLKNNDAKETVGLVTEFDFPENPEYWTMDFDQLWDIFVKQYNPDDLNADVAKQEQPQGPQGPQEPQEMDPEFIEGWNEIMDAFNNGELTEAELDNLIVQLQLQ